MLSVDAPIVLYKATKNWPKIQPVIAAFLAVLIITFVVNKTLFPCWCTCTVYELIPSSIIPSSLICYVKICSNSLSLCAWVDYMVKTPTL